MNEIHPYRCIQQMQTAQREKNTTTTTKHRHFWWSIEEEGQFRLFLITDVLNLRNTIILQWCNWLWRTLCQLVCNFYIFDHILRILSHFFTYVFTRYFLSERDFQLRFSIWRDFQKALNPFSIKIKWLIYGIYSVASYVVCIYGAKYNGVYVTPSANWISVSL